MKHLNLSFFIFLVNCFAFNFKVEAQCPSFFDTRLNGGTQVVNVCPGTPVTISSVADGLSGGATVNWYYGGASGFYNGNASSGTLFGSSTIGTPSPCPTICPDLLAVFIDACGGGTTEQNNEFLVMASGSGFYANNLQVDFNASNNGAGGQDSDINFGTTPCGLQVPTASLMTSLRAGVCNASNIRAAGPGDFIPPGAIVVLFTSNNTSVTYNLSDYCASGKLVYILQSSCARTGGAFTNAESCIAGTRYSRTQIMLQNCPNCADELIYDRCGITMNDGNYAIDIPNGIATLANGGYLRNTIDPCNGPVLNMLPLPTNPLSAVFTPTASMVNTTVYLVGTYNNPSPAPGCPAYTTTTYMQVNVLGTPPPRISGNVLICGTTSVLNAGSGYNTYLWSNGETTQAISVSNTGTYSVTVTNNGLGCVASSSVTTTAFNVTATAGAGALHDATICVGSSIQLTANAPGALSYSWSPATGLSSTTSLSPVATPTTNQTYTVTARRLGGNLVQNGDFTAGNSDFTSQYSFWTGVLPATIPFNNYAIATNPRLVHTDFVSVLDHTNNTAGSRNMLVVNQSLAANTEIWCQVVQVQPNTNYNFGLFASNVLNLTLPPKPTASLNFLANGVRFGSMQVPFLPNNWQGFNAQWNSGATTSVRLCITNTTTDDVGGDFVLDDISFDSECITTDQVRINVNAPIVAVSGNTSFCANASSLLTASPNLATNSYQWTTPSGTILTSAIITATQSGVYRVTLTNSAACTATANITVSVLPAPTVTLTTTGCGTSNLANITALSNPTNVTYRWSTGGTNALLAGLSNNTYTLTTTHSNGCTTGSTATINSPTLQVISVVPTAACFGQTGSINVSASASNASPLNYAWSNGATTSNLANARAGNFTLIITEPNSGCQTITSATITETPEIQVNAGAATTITEGDTHTLTGAVTPATASLNWTTSTATSTSLGTTATLNVRPTSTTTYLLTASLNNCTSASSVNITVNKNTGEVKYPNMFTPNNDTSNDTFFPVIPSNITPISLTIYNRWGQVLHQDVSAWDGKFSSEEQPRDSYVFRFVYKPLNGTEQTYWGNLTLVR